MKLAILSRLLILTIAFYSSVNILPQTFKKDGVIYRDIVLNPDTVFLQKQNSLDGSNNLRDPIEPPFFKNDFMVNTLDGEYGCEQSRVSAAMDGTGIYAYTWLDMRNDKREIFAQFYDSNENRIGPNFKVNDGDLIGNNSPFIAANDKGDFVIVWLQNFREVVAQRISSSGQKVGGNIKVSTTYAFNTSEPSVAVNNDGSFMIMWASEPGNSIYTIYSRLFDNSGNANGSEIIVNETNNLATNLDSGKHIAIDGTGNYCLTWSSRTRTNQSDIYLQIINYNGVLIGMNKLVSDSSVITPKYFPIITSTKDGHFLITWQQSNSQLPVGGIGARIYHSDNYFATDPFMIFEENNSWNPCVVASDNDSTFYINFLGNGRQYIQKINVNGDILIDTARVIYNSLNPFNSYSWAITDILDGHFFIAAGIYEKNDQNIYSQKFDSDIRPIGPIEKIHDDIGSAVQRNSLVKFNNQGQSIVLWEDRRNGRNDLYAQIYDQDYNPLNGNIQINDVNTEYWNLNSKEVQFLSDGTFIVAFTGSYENSEETIRLQAIDKIGEKIGENVVVKNELYYSTFDIAMGVNGNDEILLCWYYRYGAYLKRFDKNLSAISGEKNFIKSSNNLSFSPLSISVDSAFNILAVWRYYDYSTNSRDSKILGAFYNKYGNEVKSHFFIDSTHAYDTKIFCKNYNQNYAVIFSDDYQFQLKRKYTLDKDYYYEDIINYYPYNPLVINIVRFSNQKLFITYNNDLDVIGVYMNDNQNASETYKLHQYEYLNDYYDDFNGYNSVDIYDDKLIFSFESNKNVGTSSDIWANVRTIENINFGDEIFYTPVNSDYLYNNYPNPFNQKTKITYQLLSYYKVKLSIYDILGREVKVLVDKYQEKGIYEVELDASALASGVYFYRLDAFDTTIKKMLILK